MNGSGSLVCPILVGRDDLLALADRRLEAGRSGSGHLLFLAGEAGIGKTRLLGSIERRAASLGYRVVRGGTYPGDLEVSAAVLRDLARAMGRVGAHLAHILAKPGARRRAEIGAWVASVASPGAVAPSASGPAARPPSRP